MGNNRSVDEIQENSIENVLLKSDIHEYIFTYIKDKIENDYSTQKLISNLIKGGFDENNIILIRAQNAIEKRYIIGINLEHLLRNYNISTWQYDINYIELIILNNLLNLNKERITKGPFKNYYLTPGPYISLFWRTSYLSLTTS